MTAFFILLVRSFWSAPCVREPPGYNENRTTFATTQSCYIPDTCAKRVTHFRLSSRRHLHVHIFKGHWHLPEKTIKSISNGEYIEFNSLFLGNVDGHDDNLRVSFQSSWGKLGFAIAVSLSQSKWKKIDSIDWWLTAFNIYHHPLQSPKAKLVSESWKPFGSRTFVHFKDRRSSYSDIAKF